MKPHAAGPFFAPAFALSLAALITSLTSLGNTFEGALASLIAMLPTIGALVLGHLTLAREDLPALSRRGMYLSLTLAYISLLLVVLSTIV